MSGAAGLSAAKRRRAGSDFSQHQQQKGQSKGDTSRGRGKGQIDLQNPNVILSLHDRILHDHVAITNKHTQNINDCINVINSLRDSMEMLEKKNIIISAQSIKLEKRLKQLEQSSKLREGHVEDDAPSSDDENTTEDSAPPSNKFSNLNNVSFAVKEN